MEALRLEEGREGGLDRVEREKLVAFSSSVNYF